MHEKLALFPVNYETVPLVRCAHRIGYKPIALVSPNLIALSNKDISEIDNGTVSGIRLSDDYKNKIMESDSVYFIHSHEMTNFKLYKELIAFAYENGKDVFTTECLKNKLETTEKNDVNTENLRLKSIDIPIISVFAVGFNCGQMETELSVLEYFLCRGYKVLYVGDERVSKLVNGISLPAFLYNANEAVEQKIIRFNLFMYDICKKENPDVVILDVPNPIMKYNDDILNGLGVLPFIIQKSVKSDIGILCMHYIDCNYEYLQYMSRYCEYVLNCKVRYFSICDTMALVNIHSQNELEYLKIRPELVTAKIEEKGIGKDDYTLFTVNRDSSINIAIAKIENELLTNPHVL